MLSRWFSIIVVFWLGLFNKTKIVTPRANFVYIEPTPTSIVIVKKPIIRQIITEIPTPTKIILPTKIADTTPWGVAKQIDEHTWTMRIQMDEKMGMAKEILEALNNYRKVHGSGPVEWNDKLSEYALSRAKLFTELKTTDAHKGFMEKLNNEQGFRDLGFWGLGENASYGYRLEGVHIIEWMYASDEGHNSNQLNPRWTHVGIGVDGVSTALIFAKDRI